MLAVMGLVLLAVGMWAVASGYGSGHAGGWQLMGYGALLAFIGMWATKRGRRSYASREHAA